MILGVLTRLWVVDYYKKKKAQKDSLGSHEVPNTRKIFVHTSICLNNFKLRGAMALPTMKRRSLLKLMGS
jgi:hypothetical protein